MAPRKKVSDKIENFVVMYIDCDSIEAAHFKIDEFDEMNEFIRALKHEQDIAENQIMVLQNVEKVFQVRTSVELCELDAPFERREDDDED